jgi:hypothetical protein
VKLRYSDVKKFAWAQRASQRTHRFDELQPGDKVYLITCVSWRDRNNNPADQERSLRRHVEERGAKVVGVIGYTGPRYDPYYLLHSRFMAEAAGAKWLLAETTDRFIRHRDFHSIDRPDLQATGDQVLELSMIAGKLCLMTHLDPDATPSEVRSYQRKRGQWAKGNKGGGSKRKGYGPRHGDLPLSVRLKLRELHVGNASIRDIANELKLPKSTVHRWVSQFGHYWKRCAARSR